MTDDIFTLRVFAVVGAVTMVVIAVWVGMWLLIQLGKWMNR